MNYWFIINDMRVGPLTLEEVDRMDITPMTPAWRDGLPDWVMARDIPEVATILLAKGYDLGTGYRKPQPSPQPEPQYQQYQQQGWNPMQARYAQFAPQAASRQPMEPCPPSYLLWSILSTILCCTPLGIVAIIFSAKVSSAYSSGDMAKARKMSSRAQLFIILAIVLGLISVPVSIICSAL